MSWKCFCSVFGRKIRWWPGTGWRPTSQRSSCAGLPHGGCGGGCGDASGLPDPARQIPPRRHSRLLRLPCGPSETSYKIKKKRIVHVFVNANVDNFKWILDQIFQLDLQSRKFRYCKQRREWYVGLSLRARHDWNPKKRIDEKSPFSLRAKKKKMFLKESRKNARERVKLEAKTKKLRTSRLSGLFKMDFDWWDNTFLEEEEEGSCLFALELWHERRSAFFFFLAQHLLEVLLLLPRRRSVLRVREKAEEEGKKKSVWHQEVTTQPSNLDEGRRLNEPANKQGQKDEEAKEALLILMVPKLRFFALLLSPGSHISSTTNVAGKKRSRSLVKNSNYVTHLFP